jgi:hypothetical protein
MMRRREYAGLRAWVPEQSPTDRFFGARHEQPVRLRFDEPPLTRWQRFRWWFANTLESWSLRVRP